MSFKKILLIVGYVAVVASSGLYFGISQAVQTDPFVKIYTDNCAVCHGDNLQGGPQGPALIGAPLKHGDTVADIQRSIAEGFPNLGMPGWAATLPDSHIQSIAIYIAERRVDRRFTDFKMEKPLEIPSDVQRTEFADFTLEIVAQDLAPYPFSIAPLPNGDLLLSERAGGLWVVHPDGTRTEIEGEPATSDFGITALGLNYGLGWLLDVALHPNYADNGWIYLHHTDLCEACESHQNNVTPVSMNRVVRGRIRDNQWVDQEVVWSVDESLYSKFPDLGAGGRLAVDDAGHLYISVGMKGGYFEGIQDLSLPFGKIHRVTLEGEIPQDNPYAQQAGLMGSIWTYGHRSPQGLEYDPQQKQLWGSEMGPRGGDEINKLQPGLNYGWPLYSKGVDYDGTPVDYWKELNIEFDLEDIEQPVVDMTPSPAVSSFVIYNADAYPGWRGQFLVGSLKATELYRVHIEDGKHVSTEVLIKDLARIRDIEIGADGLVYLLLEHDAGSMIVRLQPHSGDLVAQGSD